MNLYAEGWTVETVEARLRALATNAVHETRKPLARVDEPWSDNDSATVENIYQMLRLLETHGEVNTNLQHARMASDKTDLSPSAKLVRAALSRETIDAPLKPPTAWSKPQIKEDEPTSNTAA